MKQVRSQLVELARSKLVALVISTTGEKVLDLNHDFSGEEVVLFTLARSPLLRETENK